MLHLPKLYRLLLTLLSFRQTLPGPCLGNYWADPCDSRHIKPWSHRSALTWSFYPHALKQVAHERSKGPKGPKYCSQHILETSGPIAMMQNTGESPLEINAMLVIFSKHSKRPKSAGQALNVAGNVLVRLASQSDFHYSIATWKPFHHRCALDWSSHHLAISRGQ